jgi:electron transfer flavoprotein beta subunit
MGHYDLIFAGRQAIDGDTAQVGPQIAEKLGLAQVTYVMEFDIKENKKDIVVKRQLEDGYEEIAIQAPCMLTAIKELNVPRYMSISGIVHACSPEADIKVWNAKDVNVDLATVGLEASPTNVYRSFTPAPKPPGIKLEADGEKEQAQLLLLKLKEKHAI